MSKIQRFLVIVFLVLVGAGFVSSTIDGVIRSQQKREFGKLGIVLITLWGVARAIPTTSTEE